MLPKTKGEVKKFIESYAMQRLKTIFERNESLVVGRWRVMHNRIPFPRCLNVGCDPTGGWLGL